jgi:eukaryotic-like serine/threonine-protein kinase
MPFYLLTSVAVFVLFIFSACAPQRPQYADEWPVYQSDNGHSGYVTAGPEPPLAEKWSFQTNGRIVEPPVLSGGQLAVGSRDGLIYLLNPETGVLIWKEEIGQGGLVSSPVISDKLIFGGRWTPYYFVYAWDRVSGERTWELQTGEILERPPLVLSAKDVLYFNVDPPLRASSEVLSSMRAVSTLDFKTLWEQPLLGVPTRLPALDTEHNLLLVALVEPPVLQALDLKTGEIKWTFPLDSKPTTAPIWGQGRVFVGTQAGYIYSLLPESGKIDWRYQIQGDEITKDMALAEKQLLITGAKNLYAFDTQSLALMWKFRAVQPLTAPVATQKHVFVGCENKLIYTLDRLTGNTRGFTLTKGEILASPVIVGPYLFVGSSDGKLYAFEEAPRPTYVQPPRR